MAQSKTPAKSSRSKTAAKKKAAPSRSAAAKRTTVKAGKAKASKAAKTTKKATRKPAAKKTGEEEVKLDRRRAGRRSAEKVEKPETTTAVEPKAEKQPKLERREKTNRRRQIDPTTCERDYSDGEVEFMNALDNYKRTSGRMFPTCSEVLEVIRDLGYVQLSPAELATLKAGRGEVDPPAAVASVEDAAEAEAIGAFADSESLREE